MDWAHDDSNQENRDDRRSDERKANPRRHVIPHQGHADERGIGDHLTESRSHLKFFNAFTRQMLLMLQQEGVNEKINALKRESGCDD